MAVMRNFGLSLTEVNSLRLWQYQELIDILKKEEREAKSYDASGKKRIPVMT